MITLESQPAILAAAPENQEFAIAPIVLGFIGDPVARWAYPDAHQYRTFFPRLVRAFGGRAFMHGTAHYLEGFRGTSLWLPPGVEPEFTCFPMIIAGNPVGVLGVATQPPLADEQRRILTTAAALLAVSLKNAELFREVVESNVRDPLTSCVTRRHGMGIFQTEMRRSRRSQLPMSLIVFDLDHFKAINDRYGHLAGDAVLGAVGGRMNSVLRGSDLKCRYGGEEFLILLPDTPTQGAIRVAETLRREIEGTSIPWNDDMLRVTASFGITSITPGEMDPLAAIARADEALYRAKQDGRNCVRSAAEAEALV